MQLFAGELTNQNREYYKVNDNKRYQLDFLCSADDSQIYLAFEPTTMTNRTRLYEWKHVLEILTRGCLVRILKLGG